MYRKNKKKIKKTRLSTPIYIYKLMEINRFNFNINLDAPSA